MSAAGSRALIDRYWKALGDRDAEGWIACHAPDAVADDYGVGDFCQGEAELRRHINEYFAAVPPGGESILHDVVVFEDGARFQLEWTMRGRLEGTFGPSTETTMGKADGQPFEARGVSIGEIEDGRFTHCRHYWNTVTPRGDADDR